MIPKFADKSDLYKFLRENKELIIKQKRSQIKEADSFTYVPTPEYLKPGANKDFGIVAETTKDLIVKAVINTTNILDSHADVHLPGLWKKSISEVRYPLLLQEHQMKFDKIIADGSDVKVFTKRMSWAKLGFGFEGSTECLMHEAVVKQSRNPFMFDQYRKGLVRNHSVGMQYVELFMCVNSEEKWWIEEKEYWEKYFSEIVNQDEADDLGYFFAVNEAKYIEGSPVVKGSNYATPTESVTEAGSSTSDKNEPPAGTHTKSFINPNLI